MQATRRLLALAALSLAPAPLQAAGVLVAAGGGSEGDIGDTSAWSYELYGRLVDNGDVNGDGRIAVAILSTSTETSWLPSYFQWLGADDAVNVRVASRADAEDPALLEPVRDADVLFLKGGDQGEYYDLWNDTTLEQYLLEVAEGGGAIGGTSAGAMSLAGYAFAGGQDLISLDVLQDATTPYLNDTDGGSGIHTDFLGLIPGAVIDTHYTSRARTGRLLGILGKAVQDSGDATLLGIGIEERTGLAISGDTAEVIGVGSVDFIQQTSSTVLRRDAGRPLYYTWLRLDRLTAGWRYDLVGRQADTTNRPSSAVAVRYPGDGATNSGSLVIRGSRLSDEEKLARVIAYAPYPYTIDMGTASPYVHSAMGLVDAHNQDFRGAIHESIFRGMYDYPDFTGFLVAFEGTLSRTAQSPDQLQFSRNLSQGGREAASIVIDGKEVTWKDLSPSLSNQDTGSGTLNAAALIGLRLHVIGETPKRGARYDTVTHAVVGGPSPGVSGGLRR